MSNLNSALQQLRDERKQAQSQVEKLDQAISVIEGLSGRTNTNTSNGSRRGRSLSAAARKRISEAQRARWAQRKKQAGSVIVSRTACGAEPEALVGLSSPQNCCCTKSEMGKVPLATKNGSLVRLSVGFERLFPQGRT